MSCIVCFLEDSFQEKIRNFSQSRSDRFEENLLFYQNNFINQYINLSNIDSCDIHSHLHTKTKTAINKIHNTISLDIDIKDFFNKIRHIYTTWIKGNYSQSATSLKEILESYHLLQLTNELNNNVFFRGRRSQSILTKKELFHIPFNRRYLIQNQRYSVTGQPLLYLGLSPLDVVAELRGNIENLTNIQFCSYLHSSNENLAVFDITNRFPDVFTNYDILSTEEINPPSIETQINPKIGFYKFMLSQLCSFKRSRWSEGSVFSEEYVLPQILTEVLRQKDFNGILFSSTRVDNTKIKSKSRFHVNKHRENLALFTSYNNAEDYDLNLYNQFIISKPILEDDISEVKLEDIVILRQEIFKGDFKSNWHKIEPASITQITGISTQTLFENITIQTEEGEIDYFSHKIGKVHLYLIYQILMDLRNRLYSQI